MLPHMSSLAGQPALGVSNPHLQFGLLVGRLLSEDGNLCGCYQQNLHY